MSSGMQQMLDNVDCARAMTGEYLVDGMGNTANQELVSVQIYPLADLSVATQAFDQINAGGLGSFGAWCTQGGPGSTPCNSGEAAFDSARQALVWSLYHRYLIVVTAVFTDLTPDIPVNGPLMKAAQAAAAQSGPQNYYGNG